MEDKVLLKLVCVLLGSSLFLGLLVPTGDITEIDPQTKTFRKEPNRLFGGYRQR
jgi:hypothetical protein